MVELSQILALYPATVRGPGTVQLERAVELRPEFIQARELSWCSQRNSHRLLEISRGVVICSMAAEAMQLSESATFVFTDNPRRYFQRVLACFFAPARRAAFRSPSAHVASSVTMGEDVYLGHNVVIEADCVIGDGCTIGHNSVLYAGTKLGRDVTIGANCSIGGAGFGYEKNEAGEFELFPHVGDVVIKDRVEIGSNTCVDRGGLGSTVLEENVKIDNLVHVAHNVHVGANSLVIANVMLGGSTRIGPGSWVSPSATILNRLTLGAHSVIGLGAVVIRDVGEGQVVVGNPARELQKKT